MDSLKKLDYEIHKYSSFSATYLPENIKEDNASNQTSRWSSNTNNPPQFLTLKLQRPAIVYKIKFGKYEKSHVCNLRKFRVLGGLEENNLVAIYEGGLKNDSIPETFDLRYKTNSGELFPIRYIQVMPLLSWGPAFNFSIWYIELLGRDDQLFVMNSLKTYNAALEVEIVRLCLKHLRQRGYEGSFKSLEDETSIQLEDPLLTQLHKTLVIEGNFLKSEQLMTDFVENGFMDQYISNQKYNAKWSALLDSKNVGCLKPGKRGGHQLVLDSAKQMIYLYGGFDGMDDLSDLWAFDIKSGNWELIHERSELHNGPTPRACHKMVFDPVSSQIFMLGRYCANKSRDYIKSDFYLFDTNTRQWFLIMDDTSQENGPGLIYDHQMCIDAEKRTIFVFGGKTMIQKSGEEASNECQYSGLFSYHISTNTWQQILVDCNHSSASLPEIQSIKSRATHSMLFHNKNRKLYIFGGQRGKEYITDFMSFDVDTFELITLQSSQVQAVEGCNSEAGTKNFPQSGFTQRATIDCDRDEIYVLTSLSKDKERRDLNVNSFWMYSLVKNEWICIYKNDHLPCDSAGMKTSQMQSIEPCPRYAHQLIYDPEMKIHYLFGGNPGGNSQVRLDDFWKLELEKPSRENILNYCKYLLRKQSYEELSKVNPIKAMKYLQTKLSETIDRTDANQLDEFHKLASLLFRTDDDTSTKEGDTEMKNVCSPTMSEASTDESCSSSTISTATNEFTAKEGEQSGGSTSKQIKFVFDKNKKLNLETRSQRCMLFNKLIELLPEGLCQPRGNLSDFVLI